MPQEICPICHGDKQIPCGVNKQRVIMERCYACQGSRHTDTPPKNAYDNHDCLARGQNAQTRFIQYAKQRGWHAAPAKTRQDKYGHWDIKIQKQSNSYKIDVKAMKRMNRTDKDVQDKWAWIELQGVNSSPGWLYGGTADMIAFEQLNGFILVNRIKLQHLIKSIVNFNIIVYRPQDAQYKVYQRKDRADKITMIETLKLKPIAWAKWGT